MATRERGETQGRRCRKCGAGSRVIDVDHRTLESRRRRECKECGYRWTTRERDDDDATATGAAVNR
jgi:transcriptional regulator NrdR family protein